MVQRAIGRTAVCAGCYYQFDTNDNDERFLEINLAKQDDQKRWVRLFENDSADSAEVGRHKWRSVLMSARASCQLSACPWLVKQHARGFLMPLPVRTCCPRVVVGTHQHC